MFKKLGILLLVLLLLGGIGLWWISSARGFSARQEPSSLEVTLARAARGMAMPSDAKETKNPIPLTPELMQEARRHFADHCSICHANDGSGNTERLTFFSDFPGYKASNPVVSDDGKFIAFQMAKSREAAGVGHGIFVYDTEKAARASK